MNPFNFLSLCILLGLLLLTQIDAFCVYNKVTRPEGTPETTFWLRQEPLHAGRNWFSRFSRKYLKAGENACCPYSDYDCVSTKNKDEILYMAARRTTGVVDYVTVRVSFPASGWIEFSGDEKPENARINVFNADGSPYAYEWKHDDRAGLW